MHIQYLEHIVQCIIQFNKDDVKGSQIRLELHKAAQCVLNISVLHVTFGHSDSNQFSSDWLLFP